VRPATAPYVAATAEAHLSLTIEETFHVHADIDRVWDYLADPARVVACVRGAELTSIEDDLTFNGRVKAKVGPVSASYSGVARMTERDEAAHTLTLTAKGRETGGSGSATFRMRAELREVGDGVDVHVTTTVDIVGRVMQFGRGMVEMVARQLFAEFVTCVRATLEQPLPAASLSDTVPGKRETVVPPPVVEPIRPVQALFGRFRMKLREWLGRTRRA
jgi:carbon monoxide dehydrogenase subunit G